LEGHVAFPVAFQSRGLFPQLNTKPHVYDTITGDNFCCRLLLACNSYDFTLLKIKLSRYRPGQALGVPEVEAPEFLDDRHMKVVRLSALRTGRLYLQEGFLVLISVRS
jgi:hypothetical protein